MRMPMKFKKTLRAFRSPVKPKTWEEVGEWVRGKWSSTATGLRDFDAIVLMLSAKELEFYSAGNASVKGGIAILTQETLYFGDVNAEGVEQRQSFVTWNGYKYRVHGNGMTNLNTDFNSYIALGYTDYAANP